MTSGGVPNPHNRARSKGSNLAALQQSDRSESASFALDPHFNLHPFPLDPLGEGYLKTTGSTPDDDGPTLEQGSENLHGFSPFFPQRGGLLRHSFEFGLGDFLDLNHGIKG